MPDTFAPAQETFVPQPSLLAKLQLPSPAGASSHHHVTGLVEMRETRPGLIVQRMKVRDVEDRETRGTVLPGLKIGVVVGGRSDFALGVERFRLGPQVSGPLSGMLVAVAEPDGYCRQAHRGQDEHKLVLTLLPEWLQQYGSDDPAVQARIRAFCASHLARLDWQPSARAVGLAHQVVHAPSKPGLVERLYQEARVTEIVAEALAAIAGAPPPAGPLSTRMHRRLRQLQARLDAGEFDAAPLDEIARSVGMSPSSLQRAFKDFCGESLFAHLRGRRLDLARQALERDGVSVSQAAAVGGYADAANFATAFKRRFGCTPRQLRARC